MNIIQPYAEIMSATPFLTKNIESAIRVCYKSENRIANGSDVKIINAIKEKKHDSCLEHGAITVRFICDRGVTHELVRHRVASYSQESSRYCTYSQDKFGGEITVIEPFFFANTEHHENWVDSCFRAENTYLDMIDRGVTAQEARSVLPNSLKTEIIMTANPREWRHVFKLRTSNAAHPQIRQVMCPLLIEFRNLWPVLFEDVGETNHTHPAAITISNRMLVQLKFEKEYDYGCTN